MTDQKKGLAGLSLSSLSGMYQSIIVSFLIRWKECREPISNLHCHEENRYSLRIIINLILRLFVLSLKFYLMLWTKKLKSIFHTYMNHAICELTNKSEYFGYELIDHKKSQGFTADAVSWHALLPCI